jgi:hypothetical protein
MPMVNGRFHMNPMWGAGVERERERLAGGHGKPTKIEVHPHENGTGFKVHVHRGGAPNVGSTEAKPEVREFPSHQEMGEFVKRLAQEMHGAPKGPRGEQAEQQPGSDEPSEPAQVPGESV